MLAAALPGALVIRHAMAQPAAFELALQRDRNLATTLSLNDCIQGKLYLGPHGISDPGMFLCDTLELPYRNELKEISCIKPGTYSGFVRTEPTAEGKDLGWRIQLEGTKQLGIQIHIGTITANTHGCILVGARGESPCDLRPGTSKAARDKLKDLYGNDPHRPISLTVLN